jgi:ABC-type Fe3+-siderophore transport system permease subunit
MIFVAVEFDAPAIAGLCAGGAIIVCGVTMLYLLRLPVSKRGVLRWGRSMDGPLMSNASIAALAAFVIFLGGMIIWAAFERKPPFWLPPLGGFIFLVLLVCALVDSSRKKDE